MSVDHYENFPVASILMPARIKPAVIAVYQFARTADDIADEGDATSEQRLTALAHFDAELDKIDRNFPPEDTLFQNLAPFIYQHQLPIAAFRDLISAFRQDIGVTRYPHYEGLLDYCRRSANPVGTIMLHLYKTTSNQNIKESDAICSALQLTNFWQDIAIDWQKQRIYLPLEDLHRFNIDEQDMANESTGINWQEMMRFQIKRTRDLMLSGSPLCKRLPGRIGWELRLVVQGGLRILERLEKVNGDVFKHRPKLASTDWLFIFWRALWM